MAHQMGICSCGKKRHWPKGSMVGDTWKCYDCGNITTLVAEGGTPTKRVPSKKPRKPKNPKPNNLTSTNNSCFPKGTMVLTPIGKKEISKLNEGDYVVSIGKDKKTYTSKILKVKSYTNKPLWTIVFNDGTSLKTTASHSFLIENRWIKSLNIKQGDIVSCYINGKIISKEVVSSSEIALEDDVYNLYIENNFNFIADGVMAHSFSYFRLTRMTLWSVYSIMLNLFDEGFSYFNNLGSKYLKFKNIIYSS